MAKICTKQEALKIAGLLARRDAEYVEKWLSGDEVGFRDTIDAATCGQLDTLQLDLMCDWVWDHLDHWDTVGAIDDPRQRQMLGM